MGGVIMPHDDRLVRVEAPHFVAGLVICGLDDRCWNAAPILGWAIDKHADELSAYFKRKGWKATVRTIRPA